MKNLQIYPRLFGLLTLGFVLATVIGTLSHELAHVAVARCLGHKTTLHYASMNHYSEASHALEVYYETYKSHIMSKKDSPEKREFFRQFNAIGAQSAIVRLGGPIQTAITGTIGVIVLWFRRKKIVLAGMQYTDWLFVLLSFFWSRQICNYLMGMYGVLKGRTSYGDDETRIDLYFGLPLSCTGLTTAIIATALLSWVTFFVIPKNQRLTFIVSGLAGSLLGWMVWLEWMGPVLLP
ncbi:MAG: hypothetical protein ACLGH8_01260 [Bacteroidia bacterium]